MDLVNLDLYADKYNKLEKLLETAEDPASLLMTFPLAPMAEEEWPAAMKVTCDYEELTAYCPWTKFPDQGRILLEYVPEDLLLELKSYKYYLLKFRDMHITQEHLAQKVFSDIQAVVHPLFLKVSLDYMPRGGIHTIFEMSTEALER